MDLTKEYSETRKSNPFIEQIPNEHLLRSWHYGGCLEQKINTCSLLRASEGLRILKENYPHGIKMISDCGDYKN